MNAFPHLVFVVDDDPMLRMQAVDLLEEAGFATIEAGTADEALSILKVRWPEVRVLFTDVQMPGTMSGVDLAEEVHRCWPDIHLLVTSGGEHIRNDDLPDDGRFLPKPYRPTGLVDQVKEMIAVGHPSEGRPGLPLG